VTAFAEEVTPALVMNDFTWLPMWFAASAGAKPAEPVAVAAAASALMCELSVAESVTAPEAVTLVPALGRATCVSTMLLMSFVDEAATMLTFPDNESAPVIEKISDDSVSLRPTVWAVAVA